MNITIKSIIRSSTTNSGGLFVLPIASPLNIVIFCDDPVILKGTDILSYPLAIELVCTLQIVPIAFVYFIGFLKLKVMLL